MHRKEVANPKICRGHAGMHMKESDQILKAELRDRERQVSVVLFEFLQWNVTEVCEVKYEIDCEDTVEWGIYVFKHDSVF